MMAESDGDETCDETAFFSSVPSDMGVIDCGCTTSLIGDETAEVMMTELSEKTEQKRKPRKVKHTTKFKGIGGNKRAMHW